MSHKKGHGISVIIPFRKSDKYLRQHENFKWVKKYWACQLPGAQIIVGEDPKVHLPFSKSTAINEAFKKVTGDVVVLTDADGYIAIEAVLLCAERIRRDRKRGRRLWYVPYRRFYRLKDEPSKRVIKSDPCHPYKFSCPPPKCDIQNTKGSDRGHWFGALIQIMPREAFEMCGGWDPRFRGWGGEDHSAMRAMDTLYWPHKTLPGQVLHLWHPAFSKEGKADWVSYQERVWDGQKKPQANGNLAMRYSRAFGSPKRMRKLMDEWREEK